MNHESNARASQKEKSLILKIWEWDPRESKLRLKENIAHIPISEGMYVAPLAYGDRIGFINTLEGEVLTLRDFSVTRRVYSPITLTPSDLLKDVISSDVLDVALQDRSVPPWDIARFRLLCLNSAGRAREGRLQLNIRAIGAALTAFPLAPTYVPDHRSMHVDEVRVSLISLWDIISNFPRIREQVEAKINERRHPDDFSRLWDPREASAIKIHLLYNGAGLSTGDVIPDSLPVRADLHDLAGFIGIHSLKELRTAQGFLRKSRASVMGTVASALTYPWALFRLIKAKSGRKNKDIGVRRASDIAEALASLPRVAQALIPLPRTFQDNKNQEGL